jgi:chemotaxis protein CheD
MAPCAVDLPRVHLAAAEIHITRKPEVVETVLGSCVAATLWIRRLRVGAMCHGALPCCPEQDLRSADFQRGFRYVDFAIRYLVRRLFRLGAQPEEIEVKLFGGGDVLQMLRPRGAATVGRQNCESALRTLVDEGLTPAVSDLGGRNGRVIYFHTDNGDVFVRRLPSGGARGNIDFANAVSEEIP